MDGVIAAHEIEPTPFRCPWCQGPLRATHVPAGLRCATCARPVGSADGIFDFVRDGVKEEEGRFYDGEYAGAAGVAPPSISSLRALWVDNPYAPHNEAMWRRMQDVDGATVVVLGSGASPRELYFLELGPQWLVISDLSKAPLRAIRRLYIPDPPPNAVLAAIDAEQMPFADASVDVIVGYAFVHHLPDLDTFLREVARVLRPGGRAVFLDAAFAPLWECSKRTWLRLVMKGAHRINPISPEDLRFTMAGGFRIEELIRRITAVGGVPWFECSGGLHYLAVRASEIAARRLPGLSLGRREWQPNPAGTPPFHLRWRHRRALELLRRLDQLLVSRSRIARRNQVRLVWGFEMPAGC